ncbi:MAG TPA: O-antigen ligase family protein, partial [Desulfobacteria bacterium]|nr:O-antigen ligase family protein [Desulfobacteria bacterium]
GFFDIHEGTLAFLSCMILFFAATNLKYTEKMLQTVVYCLYPLMFINAGLSLLAFYGVNVLKWPVVKGLILPSELLKAGGLSADSVLQSTLSNPNYVSGLGGVLAVFFLVRGILAEENRPAVTNLLLAAVAFSMIISAKSTSGFLTLVLMLPVIFYFISRTNNRVRRASRLGLTLIGFVLILATLTLHDPLAWNESMGFFVGEKVSAAVTQPAPVNTVTDKQNVTILDPNDELYLPPKSLSAGNGRFYIWRKTIELVKKRPIMGYGLDTLAYYFPQHDKEKITQDLGRDDMTQKPHNLFLGIAFGSGLLALGAFVLLLVRHLIANVRLFWGPVTGQSSMLYSLFAAWVAFLLQGMFNDFTIATSVIFWILFGVGVSLRKKQMKAITNIT